MSVNAIRENYYSGPPKDAVENFHGNWVVYVAWDDHNLFSYPSAFPLPPTMPFGDLVRQVLPSVYSLHPDFDKIDWQAVEWEMDDRPFSPRMEASLADNGVTHKTLLRMRTPGLAGIKGSLA